MVEVGREVVGARKACFSSWRKRGPGRAADFCSASAQEYVPSKRTELSIS